MSSHTLCSFHVAWSNICHVYFSAPCFDEEVHPITDVCFLPPTSWWVPPVVREEKRTPIIMGVFSPL